MEDLFLSKDGEATRDVLDGVYDRDGKTPSQIDGGLKCFGHPIAASGLRMAYETYNQLLGRAGERQLADVSLGLTHNLGGVPYQGIAAISILGETLMAGATRQVVFSAEHEAFRDSVRRFVVEELVPSHEAWEEAQVVPRAIWRRAGELGSVVPEHARAIRWPGRGLAVQRHRHRRDGAGRRHRAGLGLHGPFGDGRALHPGRRRRRAEGGLASEDGQRRGHWRARHHRARRRQRRQSHPHPRRARRRGLRHRRSEDLHLQWPERRPVRHRLQDRPRRRRQGCQPSAGGGRRAGSGARSQPQEDRG